MRIVQAHGCFDLLHIGHIRHFEAAKRHGDRLIVTVTPDKFVRKGPGRPVFSESLRMEAVAALACVDEVRLSPGPTAAEAIRDIRPTVFAKGPDYSEATFDPGERQALADVGGYLLITDTPKWSSTELLLRDRYPPEAADTLAAIRRAYTLADVRGWLERARALNVLVIGDAIRDEYVYVDCLGKSGKDPILAVQHVRTESHAGGAHAVERHLRAVVDHADVVVGNQVTVKRRYVEQYPFQKLFETYRAEPNRAYRQRRDAHIAPWDVVLAADYGHGVLSSDLITTLAQRAKFLAVNVQANAGNHGFNTISKYPSAHFISLSERELRLDARDQITAVETLLARLADRYCATVLVTRGEKGCLVGSAGAAPATAPALTTHAVDRTGAGDAVFAVSACCAAVGMPADLMSVVASVVGTQAVAIVGNARYIERASLRAAIEQLWA